MLLPGTADGVNYVDLTAMFSIFSRIMKKLLLILTAISLPVCSMLKAQPALEKAASVEDFRPIGEARVWTFVVKDSAIGQLTSIVSERKKIDGIEGVTFTERLILDYNLIGSLRKTEIEGKHFVSLNGYYLGDDRNITINDQAEKQKVERDGERIEGYFTRGGEEIDQEVTCPPTIFAIENNFPDQYELFFAMRGLRVGETIIDSVLEPQTMLITRIKAVVEDFFYTRIHSNLSDSVFLVNVFEPQPMDLLFSKEGSLLKMNIPGMRTRVYLDVVRQTQAPDSRQQQFSWSKLASLIPSYILFVVFAGISVLFFIGGGFRWSGSYIALTTGAIVFWLLLITQMPLQQHLVVKYLIPAIRGGESLYAAGTLPGLTAGVIQELLKLLSIFAVALAIKPRNNQMVAMGAMLAAGFGLIEGCYLESMVPTGGQFSWNLLERAFLILFHVTSGGLMAYFLRGRAWKLALVVLGLIVCNATFRYLPLFVQQQVVEAQVMHLTIAAVSVILLLVAMLLVKRRSIAA